MENTKWMVLSAAILAAAAAFGAEPPAADLKPRDLTPVTWLKATAHAPVEIVRDGQPLAAVYIAESKPGWKLMRLVDELVEVVRLGTGATLERVEQPPPADRPAIVIGDCEEARAAGLASAKLRPEEFAVKTAPNRVYLVGGTGNPDGTAWAVADFLERFAGVRWYWPARAAGRSIPRAASLVVPPVYYTDRPVFLNRLNSNEVMEFPDWSWALYMPPLNVDAHNYGDRLSLPPAPGVMEGDEDWYWRYMQGMHALQRLGESLDFTPGIIQGSADPAWWLGNAAHAEDVQKAGEAARAMNKDGTRHARWICFSAPETLDALLARLSRHWDRNVRGWPPYGIMTDTSCTVYFPRTPGLVCHCPRCRKTADRLRKDRRLCASLAKEYGEQRAYEVLEERVHELVFGLFLQRLCEAVKQRWPDKKVVFSAGERKPPAGVKFPANLRVASVWPEGFAMGQAMHPTVGRGFDATIRSWGHVLIWAWAFSPSDWTYGPVQYPHLVQDFYRRNREFITGSDLNLSIAPILLTGAPTFYVWQRVLWNPELDVDATLDEMCRRLFGAGAQPARELLRLECDRWERTPLSRPLQKEDLHRDRLPGTQGLGSFAQEHRLPRDLFREIWPADVVARMKELRDRALDQIETARLGEDTATGQAGGNADARRAFLYWTWTFDAFLEEAAAAHRRLPADFVREGGRAPLRAAEGLAENLAINLGPATGSEQDGVELKLTLIRPGEFRMGSETNSWGHHPNESPLHRVRITRPFYLGICEVTRAQYDAVMGTDTAGDAPNRPASGVSWREATNFCGRASQQTGRRVRLPTEAEWEYACRAGTTTPWSFGDAERVEEVMKESAWYGTEARDGPRDVGGKQPNAWGLYDMHGNASEWCMDRFGEDYYALSPMDDPSGPETGIFRVMRGGSAYHLMIRNVEFTRSARRAWGHPDLRIMQRGMSAGYVGLRVVVEGGDSGR
jgi:formylglycine-generating enzyme required for sulfatase activity